MLFLAHRIPYPPNKGDKIRSYHILRHLAAEFRIHLGCFFDDAADRDHADSLREFCSEVFCLPLGRTQKLVRGIGGIVEGRSVSEACYRDARMRKWTRETIEHFDIRDVFVYCSTMAPYVREFAQDRRVILDLIDVDSEKWRAYSLHASWPLRPLFRLEQRRVLELERRAAGASTRVLFVSPAEKRCFAALAPEHAARVSALENGVDLQVFDPSQSYACPFASGVRAVVFTGAMDYRANVDAVSWFARDVLPAVRRVHANCEFWIVGGNPSRAVLNLSSLPGIRVTGAVADVRPFLAHAVCAVAPMRVARGIQNKVLEAMAMAKPVVLTSVALQGLRAECGREVLVGDSADDFANCISAILSGRWSELGRAARERVAADYNWSVNLELLDELFQDPGHSRGRVSRMERAISAHAL